MRVRQVPKHILGEIRNEYWVDRTRRPCIEDEIAWVPVKEGEPFDRDIPPPSRYQGRGYYMIGDIAVIHGTRPGPEEIKEIVSFRHPRGVLWIEALHDVTRTPHAHLLWGEGGEVSHRESGYTYILDPTRVMFAQGNREEKMRMASLIRESGSEVRVADMFAGIGYFTIPMAGTGAYVHAMEINPVSYDYLQKNILENRLSDRIQPSLGDCRELLKGTYDRIVMGHFDAIEMLPSIIPHVSGGSIIHIHSVGSVEDRIRTIMEGAGFSVSINVHKVKKYRPHAWHVVQDVTIK
ncbi:SAM-dependent methyltransferase [uncultured Methanoregula sp.]|uniref:class I SAM-dependent methyltransferase n=1 Tax=uncultured Methanoregula sp. TaxID=1005933 RepID=UPI002AABF90B|nr:SAM-dependent methyltransferase [uncultured Methanoregula sp.]